MDRASIALLLLEWQDLSATAATTAQRGPRDSTASALIVCPLCHSDYPRHNPDCTLDLALAERGFALQQDRDAGRLRIRGSETPTLPALEPPPSEPSSPTGDEP